MSTAEYKEMLLIQIEGTAEWRSRKSEEYPQDDRNRASAESLTRLAKRLQRISPSNRYLQRLCRLEDPAVGEPAEGDNDGWALVEELMEIRSHTVSRYGFDGRESGNAGAFLQELLEEYQRSIQQRKKFEEAEEAARISALPILFVEGTTDATIVKAAWYTLFPHEALPVNLRPSQGTKQLRSLSATGTALREVMQDKVVLVLADNDRSGRSLVNDGHLHKGGAWRQLTNGVHWCLLKPTAEFVSIMERLRVPRDYWPCTIEACFATRILRSAEAEGAYAFSKSLLHDLHCEPEVSKRLFAVTRKRRKADDAYFYLMAPTPRKKEAFANWIAANKTLSPGDFCAFEPILTGLRQILSDTQTS